MKLNLTQFTRKPASEWLVVEFNGFCCTGLHATIKEGTPCVERLSSVTDTDLDKAFAKLLTDLQSDHRELPTRAILLTSQAAAAIVQLPINPAVPSKREQLQALVQWEFEQILAEQTTALSLETILVGCDHMSEEEVDQVRLAIGEQKATQSCIATTPKKFGAQAVKMGFITDQQLEDCLQHLEQFHQPEDTPRCQFSPVNTDEIPQGNEGFPWLVCGIGTSTQARWVDRFASRNIRLERIYPLGFTGAAALPAFSQSDQAGLISLLSGADCYTAYRNHHIQSLRWGPAPLSPRNPEALCALIGDDELKQLWIEGDRAIVQDVAPILEDRTRYPVHSFLGPLPNNPAQSEQPRRRLTNMIGALRHQTKQTPLQTPWVDGAPPPPPWWHQASKWWGITGIVVLIFIVLSELILGLQHRSIMLATQEVQKQNENAKGEISKVELENQTADQLAKTRAELKKSLAVTSQAADLIEQGLELREQYVIHLFDELARSVSSTIAIDQFQELEDHSILISAWALSETDAQEFIHQITAKMAPWGLTLAHQEVQVQAGRLGLMGYDLGLRLAPSFNSNYPSGSRYAQSQ